MLFGDFSWAQGTGNALDADSHANYAARRFGLSSGKAEFPPWALGLKT
jgi:hypothetical protein